MLKVLEIDALPENLDARLFIDAMHNSQFILCHDLMQRKTCILAGKEFDERSMENAVVGMRLKEIRFEEEVKDMMCLVVYNQQNDAPPLDNIYSVLGGMESRIFVSFAPAGQQYVKILKDRIEDTLSNKEVRMTKSIFRRNRGGQYAVQTELYYDSESRKVLLSSLEVLGETLVNNGVSYKTCILIDRPCPEVVGYIKSRLLVIDEFRMGNRKVSSIFNEVPDVDALPCHYTYAATMLSFSDRIRRRVIVKTPEPVSAGDITFGNFLRGGESITDIQVKTHASTLNLGVIITGMPGSGKTRCAMNIVSQIVGLGNTKVIVISPTDEWNSMCIKEGMNIVKIYDDHEGINFFRCESNINVERFYENLAMLIASASKAGPYKNSFEKCLLSAFRKTYFNTKSPDPITVYERIEEEIMERHSNKNSLFPRYTKHGENIRAALESLRLMLNREQFAYSVGINLRECIENGVVFDMSKVSNTMKPFFYAMVLNQIYSFTEEMDNFGDGELRMLICIEESHLVFGEEDRSAAVMDLKQRIQDFRKKGVCLALITHNAAEIDNEVRRLCQTKAYFRQSPDVAKHAALDLAVNEKDMEMIINKLQKIGQRDCMLAYVNIEGAEKNPEDTIIIKTNDYTAIQPAYNRMERHDTDRRVSMTIKLKFKDGKPVVGKRVDVCYLGERIYRSTSDDEGKFEVNNIMKGIKYNVLILGEKKKDTAYFEVRGDVENVIWL